MSSNDNPSSYDDLSPAEDTIQTIALTVFITALAFAVLAFKGFDVITALHLLGI